MLGIKLIEISSSDEIPDLLPLVTSPKETISDKHIKRASRDPVIHLFLPKDVDKHLVLLHRVLEDGNVFLMRAVYLRAKSYFSPISTANFVDRCKPGHLAKLQVVSNLVRSEIHRNKELFRTKRCRSGVVGRGLARLSRGHIPHTATSAERHFRKIQRRAMTKLSLEQLNNSHYLVYGGKNPHRVMKVAGQYICDCQIHSLLCSHVTRVQIELEERASEMRLVYAST